LPLRTPPNSNGTTSSPSSATSHRIGRIKRGPFLPVHTIVFGKEIRKIKPGSASARIARAGRPGVFFK
jgi:hypothetical protein